MQHLDNVLVVGGEDKPKRELMQKAVQELLDKHKGANAAVYGDLGYLILFATAADAVSVFALNLSQNSRLEPLIPEFVVSHAASTKRALNIDCNKIMLCGVANDQLVYNDMLDKISSGKCRWWTWWVGSALSSCSSI